MNHDTRVQLIVAAFDGEARAEAALDALREANEDEALGIQAAVAMRKDAHGALHFRDVGMTPGKGAVGGLVLGAVVGILTGGTGLALGALGAIFGGVVGRKRRDSGISTDRMNQIAAALPPSSSAILAVVDGERVTDLEKALTGLGADLLTAEISPDVGEQLHAYRDTAHAVLTQELVKAERNGPPDTE